MVGEPGCIGCIDDWNNANSLTLAGMDRYPGKIYVLSYESLFLEHRGLDELFNFIGLEPGSAVRARFQRQIEKSKNIVSKRTEILSGSEKLSVCLRADTDSFRRLIERIVVLPLILQVESGKTEGSEISTAKVRSIREGPLPGSGAAAARELKEGKFQESDRAIVDYQSSIFLDLTPARIRWFADLFRWIWRRTLLPASVGHIRSGDLSKVHIRRYCRSNWIFPF